MDQNWFQIIVQHLLLGRIYLKIRLHHVSHFAIRPIYEHLILCVYLYQIKISICSIDDTHRSLVANRNVINTPSKTFLISDTWELWYLCASIITIIKLLQSLHLNWFSKRYKNILGDTQGFYITGHIILTKIPLSQKDRYFHALQVLKLTRQIGDWKLTFLYL